MSIYAGQPVTVGQPVEEIYTKLSSLDSLGDKIADAPEELKAKLGDVKFENGAIVIPNPQIGELRLEFTEKIYPSKLVLTAVSSPIPASVVIELEPLDESNSKITPSMDVEVPAMLRPFIGGKLQKAADQFGEMLLKIV